MGGRHAHHRCEVGRVIRQAGRQSVRQADGKSGETLRRNERATHIGHARPFVGVFRGQISKFCLETRALLGQKLTKRTDGSKNAPGIPPRRALGGVRS